MRDSTDNGEEIELHRKPTPEQEKVIFEGHDHKNRRLQNEKLEDEIKLRKEYTKTAKYLAWTWAGFSIFMALLQFCKPYGKHLEQAEFIAIVATALATVVTLYVQVGKGMFARNP
ncbi:MAG: hypothetical protein EXR08_07000 [Alphaproteobacteria bacterium]|nr:hypothetical protein [Alphaproteobacteria bacterium]